jgi:hypothetical protein
VELFAHREPDYTFADVVRLLGISESALQAAIAVGDISTEPNDRGQERIPWEEVAILAFEEWTPRIVDAALSTRADEIIPYLNQHRVIKVSLPIYLIRLMDHLAREESAKHHVPRNASDVIERILHDFATAQDAGTLDLEVRGFAQALAYPFFTPPHVGVGRRHCRYCGIAIKTALLEVCGACQARHEPKEHMDEYGLPELDQ